MSDTMPPGGRARSDPLARRGAPRDGVRRDHALERPHQAWILEQVHDAVVSTDLEGRISSWNPAATRIYGWTAEEATGRHIGILYFEEDRSRLEPHVFTPLRTQGWLEITTRNRHRSGREVLVDLRLSLLRDDAGRPLGVVACASDVSERERGREAARRERELLERILGTARCIVLLLDTEGRIVRFNRFMEELSGVRLEEVRGRSWFETFLPERDRPRIRGIFDRAVAHEQTRGNINAIVTRDGSERSISWWDTTFKDEDGRPCVLAIGHDVTDLLEAQERSLRSERLAAIGETVTMICHESGNELVALGMGLRSLGEGPDGAGPGQKELVSLLRESHGRLQRLFEDLRGFGAPIQLALTEVDLAGTWRRAWASLEAEWRPEDVLRERIQTPPVVCAADPLWMEQAFRNLFENALAARSGPVVVEVECRTIRHRGRRQLRIAVRNDGPALTAEQRDKAFDSFFSTKRGGSGLGLPIVRRILEAHGGAAVVGRPEQGAEFVLRLPRDPVAA